MGPGAGPSPGPLCMGADPALPAPCLAWSPHELQVPMSFGTAGSCDSLWSGRFSASFDALWTADPSTSTPGHGFLYCSWCLRSAPGTLVLRGTLCSERGREQMGAPCPAGPGHCRLQTLFLPGCLPKPCSTLGAVGSWPIPAGPISVGACGAGEECSLDRDALLGQHSPSCLLVCPCCLWEWGWLNLLADNMGKHIPGQAVGGEGINHCLLAYPWLMGGKRGSFQVPQALPPAPTAFASCKGSPSQNCWRTLLLRGWLGDWVPYTAQRGCSQAQLPL